jgi:hypothetical protein
MFILVGIYKLVRMVALLAWWLFLAIIGCGLVIDQLCSRGKREPQKAAA